jgi:hypothetical protein
MGWPDGIGRHSGLEKFAIVLLRVKEEPLGQGHVACSWPSIFAAGALQIERLIGTFLPLLQLMTPANEDEADATIWQMSWSIASVPSSRDGEILSCTTAVFSSVPPALQSPTWRSATEPE